MFKIWCDVVQVEVRICNTITKMNGSHGKLGFTMYRMFDNISCDHKHGLEVANNILLLDKVCVRT